MYVCIDNLVKLITRSSNHGRTSWDPTPRTNLAPKTNCCAFSRTTSWLLSLKSYRYFDTKFVKIGHSVESHDLLWPEVNPKSKKKKKKKKKKSVCVQNKWQSVVSMTLENVFIQFQRCMLNFTVLGRRSYEEASELWGPYLSHMKPKLGISYHHHIEHEIHIYLVNTYRTNR